MLGSRLPPAFQNIGNSRLSDSWPAALSGWSARAKREGGRIDEGACAEPGRTNPYHRAVGVTQVSTSHLSGERHSGQDSSVPNHDAIKRNKRDCTRGGGGSGHRGAREAAGQMPDPLCAFVGQGAALTAAAWAAAAANADGG